MGDSLVERDFETRAVRRSMAGLAGGAGSVLALAAPAGLGKTALLRVARDHAREQGFTVLTARGAQLESAFGYGVVRQLVEPARRLAGEQHRWLFPGPGVVPGDPFAAEGGPGGAIDPDLVEGPDGLFGPDSARFGRGRFLGSASVLLNGLYRMVTELAEHKPVVVIVDDMQWVDSPSARFLGFLARRVESAPVSLIVGARSSRHQHDESLDEILTSAETMLLQPRSLSRAAAAELVRREFGRAGDPAFCAACHETTGGNPLFLRELLRILVSEGVSPQAGSVAAVRAAGPAAVRRHMLVALRRRSAEARSVARAVAVLGDGTDLAMVAWQCGQSVAATAAAAEQLTRDGLFERADPPAFAHAAVRDAVLVLTTDADRMERSDRVEQADRRFGSERSAGPDRPERPERLDHPERPRPSGMDAFTSAEREVAGLAVSGLMNRQIAQKLFLSEKTIESHLSRVYRKTGVRSRTQLAAHLAAVGHPERIEAARPYQRPPVGR